MRNDTAKFFTAFGNEHAIAHQDLVVIQQASGALGSALDSFASTNYGASFDLSVLQCILKQFINIFSVLHVQADQSIDSLGDECDTLVDMADDFRFSQNLICNKHAKLTGCEAELNQLRCDLTDFFNLLNKAARQAEKDLSAIKRTSSTLGRIQTQFTSQYHLTCAQSDPEPQAQGTCQCNKRNINNLQNDIRSFYSEFRRPYDAGVPKLNDLSAICDNLIVAINAWNAKFA